MVYALVFVRGSVNAVDNPTRQSFVTEMVGSERVVNAVGLNSALIHAARIFGPGLAGVLIATVGIATCFLLNSLTFAAMISPCAAWTRASSTPPPALPRRRGALRDTLRHVAATPALAVPLAMMAVVGTLGFNFQVILPVFARTHLRRRRLGLHGAGDRDGGRRARRIAVHRAEAQRLRPLPRGRRPRVRRPGGGRRRRPDPGRRRPVADSPRAPRASPSRPAPTRGFSSPPSPRCAAG